MINQGAGYARTCGIVLGYEICGYVLGVSTVSCHGCHHHSMLEGYGADLNGLKELGSGHCKACGLEVLLMLCALHTVLS